MIYLPSALLTPGMVLACDLPSSNPHLPLMVAGQNLTESAIQSVRTRGIPGLYIEHACSDDIHYEPILPPEQKRALLLDIHNEFDKVTRKNTEPDYRNIAKMAESIVMAILGQDPLMCHMIDIRDYDNYTYSHSLYVGMISAVLGAQWKLPPKELTDLTTAGLLHDVGKLDIPPAIINKKGRLTSEEFALIRQHPNKAVQRLRRRYSEYSPILQGVGSHHEYYDGSGYPKGISGTNIPLYGRILAIADVYDALSANRSYRDAWNPGEIHDYLTSRIGIQFDPQLLDCFLRTIPAYPKGTLVRLSDQSIALVIEVKADLPLRPTLRVLAPADRVDQEMDLSNGHYDITILDVLREQDAAACLGIF